MTVTVRGNSYYLAHYVRQGMIITARGNSYHLKSVVATYGGSSYHRARNGC